MLALAAPRQFTDEGPAPAVDRRRPVPPQRRLVERGGIALVPLEGVGREVVRLLAHQPVPHHLGQYRGRRHRRALGVAVDDRPHRRPRRDRRGWRNRSTGPSTRTACGDSPSPARARRGRHPEGLGHPPLVALGRRGVPDRPGLAPRADRVEDLLAACLAEHLGVPQPRRHGPQLHAGAHDGDADGHGTGPGAAAHLVEAGDRLESLGAQAALLFEVGRADGHRVTGARASYDGGVSSGGEGSSGGTDAVAAGTGDEGRRAQPLPGHVGPRLRDRRGHRRGYRIRRMSDGSVLGELFSRDDVRRERSRQGFWWH